MRASRFLAIIFALAVVLTACQGADTGTPTTQPPDSTTTPTTTPPTTTPPTSTPPTTPPTTTPPTTPPTTAPDPVTELPNGDAATYQVWGATNGVIARSQPGTKNDEVGRFATTARDIVTTGRRAQVAGDVWVEVKLSGSSLGWVPADTLVHQITELTTHRAATYVVTGLTAGDKLNVRRDPGVDHEPVTSLATATAVKTTGLRAEVQGAVWMQVEYLSGKKGWVNARYLTPQVTTLADDQPNTYQVTGLSGDQRLNVRKGPGVHEAAVTTLAADAKDIRSTGNRAEVLGAIWREIEYADGKKGWVSAAFLEVQPPPAVPACRPGGQTFCPNLDATRGAVAAMLARALGLTDSGGKDWFWDDNGSPFEAEINALAAAGIVTGSDPANPGKFSPNEPATRRIAAVMFSRALGLTDDGGRDWFSDDDGRVGEADINRLAAAGIVRGCDSTGELFCPDDTIVRGQLAAWLTRAFDLPAAGQDYWTDDNGSLFEDAINRITSAGIAKR